MSIPPSGGCTSGGFINATTATGHTIRLTSGFDPGPVEVEHGPLCRLQERLQTGRLWWFGNRVSTIRYWLWRLCR